MQVFIKDFDVQMELKNNGIELEIRTPSGDHLGDLVITKTQLIWCRGRTARANGISASWDTFMSWMEED